MKKTLPLVFSLVLLLLLPTMLTSSAVRAADLPSVTMEHLYYLQARADRVRKYKPDEMVEYCIAQKIGGTAFDYLTSQLFTLRIDLAKLTDLQEASATDSRVVALTKTIDVYTRLLHEEAAKVQNGLIREGQIATDTLGTIAKAQQAAR